MTYLAGSHVLRSWPGIRLSETTETNVLFRIVPKLVSVPVSVVSIRNWFRRTPYGPVGSGKGPAVVLYVLLTHVASLSQIPVFEIGKAAIPCGTFAWISTIHMTLSVCLIRLLGRVPYGIRKNAFLRGSSTFVFEVQ